MRTIRVRVPRPPSGWVSAACHLAADVEAVSENIPLYVVLRQVQMKMAGADRGDLITQVLPLEFSVEGARMFRDYLEDTAAIDLGLYERLRDALDDHEEAERDRELFARLREYSVPPAETVRERWEVEEGVQGAAGSEQGADG